MQIDFSSLEKAIVSLEDILQQPLNEYVRDGVIQRFEYTFELCWKFMQRILKEQGLSTGSPKQVLRDAHKAKFIDDLELWMSFLKERNLTSHTYNKDVAEEVYQSARKFPPYAKQLLQQLKNEA
ncbi:MAG: nucleotidyltransferase substrate binding protein [Bdellovibrionaceae bacterium]|nr:nucleotidyltransferase substrate binding protein [Pseudobdellovibrionaceae bacterium]